jgi:hypothetical protein
LKRFTLGLSSFQKQGGVSMKVIIHHPSLPLLLAGIFLEIPVVKVPRKVEEKAKPDGLAGDKIACRTGTSEDPQFPPGMSST